MKKLYNEKQYKEYSDILERMANEDGIIDNANVYLELVEWERDNKITKEMTKQMDQRLEEEHYEEE
ncbi:hypothetical protein [Paraliobacillus ryukyuensis]|uniref:hypothetical protein n=1 Tax=Paraliobacillus ryukyuensis TaxID=200904 RepID=UPI0009A5DB8A|nr:hypothetical protein [Paraliobacillus ryukyuensis]